MLKQLYHIIQPPQINISLLYNIKKLNYHLSNFVQILKSIKSKRKNLKSFNIYGDGRARPEQFNSLLIDAK
jgi:hypothetical protein